MGAMYKVMDKEIALKQISPVYQFVGTSRAAQEARDFAKRVAGSDLTVLLSGETGVGKDHLAELIHQAGNDGKPFVVVDCGALTETLSETELFGHTRGAFTDARDKKVGLVEAAEGGTLFFNEVANMSLGLQAKFLRILDKKPFLAVGGRSEIPVKTRIIAATNTNLAEAVNTRTFRLDLFHRLTILPFLIAPLRDRKEDIPDLICALLKEKAKRFSPTTLAVMMNYDWPGNVRELNNVVQRAVLMGKENEINLGQIKPHLTNSTDYGPSLPMTLRELERNYFHDVLIASKGVQRKAAKIAGVSPPTVRNKIKAFGLEDFVRQLHK